MTPDRAMNLSQLAKLWGYDRTKLGAILKPHMIGGKIRPSHAEKILWDRSSLISHQLQPVALGLEALSHELQCEDKSRAQYKKCDPPTSSHALAESLFHSSGSQKSPALNGS